jgi:hypothetical protein
VGDLLSRKLRLLAASRNTHDAFGAKMLQVHAAGLEFLDERSQGLEAGMEVRDAHIAALATDIESAGVLAVALQHQIAQAQTQLELARKSLAQAQHALDEMRSSMSWRLTRPLRRIADIAIRILPWKR